MNENPLSQITGIFNKLTFQQKVVIGGTVGVTVVMLITLLFFLNRPDYSPLFTNLTEDDAAKVVNQLNSQKIPYEITNDGKVIQVPKDKVYEERISLASKGIPSSGVVGYEIFDKSTMGMSEFMQKLDYKRALEGELAKTIMEIDGVEGARVHIVIPQRSVFKDEQKPPTAAVVLKLRSGYYISRNYIAAILNLVSSSVEGLKPTNVTLLDTEGQLLSKEEQSDPLAVSSSKQYEIRKTVEKYLAQKAQSILNNVLGYGNSMVEVNADLNFDQVQKTMETYDPNSQVAISQQTIKTTNSGKNLGDSTNQSSQNNVTNYEINKTIEKVVEGGGVIQKLSVAAVVNDIPKQVTKDGKTETVYQPRSQIQMNKLAELIKNAVGIDPSRKDQFSIVNIPFATKETDDVKIAEPDMMDNINKYINPLMMILAVVASLFLLKGLMKRLKNQKIVIGTFEGGGEDVASDSYIPSRLKAGKGSPQIGGPPKRKKLLPLGDLEDEISDEAEHKKIQQEKIVNYVSKNPVDAAKLINVWLHEDEF